MTILMTSDLHFTDRPKDQYRFDLFPWLEKHIKKHNVSHLFLLGDITDSKDRHSSKLVNLIVDNLVSISHIPCLEGVILLRGNHDCFDAKDPFFSFLSEIPKLIFISEPMVFEIPNKTFLMLPHSRDPMKDWVDLEYNVDFIFMHQTMNGSIASSGQEMEGLKERIFKGSKARIYSGDIHVPQELGKVTYVGAPYRITFGDEYDPRILLFNTDWTTTDLKLKTTSKHTIRISNPDKIKKGPYKKGDQVKVILQLKKSDLFEWENYRRKIINVCDKLGLDLCGLELEKVEKKSLKEENNIEKYDPLNPTKTFDEFCELHKLDKFTREAGAHLLK